jgi:predicted nucleotidyltransferase
MDIIYEAIVGSRLYGINTETSDLDTKGCFFRPYHEIVPNVNNYFGLEHYKKDEVVNKNNGLEGKDKVESVFYSIKKFIELSLKGNPTLLEIAFVPRDKILVNTLCSQEIMEYVRKNFVTKKALKAYIGYFLDQKKNNINTPKKACHAFRIGIQALQFSKTGIIEPVLTGRFLEQALDIRSGRIIDDDLNFLINTLDLQLRAAEGSNLLPEEANEGDASKFLVHIHQKYYDEQAWLENEQFHNLNPGEVF